MTPSGRLQLCAVLHLQERGTLTNVYARGYTPICRSLSLFTYICLPPPSSFLLANQPGEKCDVTVARYHLVRHGRYQVEYG